MRKGVLIRLMRSMRRVSRTKCQIRQHDVHRVEIVFKKNISHNAKKYPA
jgi:hypothetical protein